MNGVSVQRQGRIEVRAILKGRERNVPDKAQGKISACVSSAS